MTMAENMAEFFTGDEFATSALYNGSVVVNVIFDVAYADQFGMVGANPIITANAADFASASQGQTLAINSVNYKIHNIEPDGTGIVRLELVKA
jgi:hypothetical protein